VNAIIRNRIAARKRRLQQRLHKDNYPDDLSQPMIRGTTPQYELSGRSTGTTCGGIGLMHQLVRELGLAEAIDRRLHLFKVHLPYHESDHVLNLAYNALCGGTCLVSVHRDHWVSDDGGAGYRPWRVARRRRAALSCLRSALSRRSSTR
jgi:hypothetical protein